MLIEMSSAYPTTQTTSGKWRQGTHNTLLFWTLSPSFAPNCLLLCVHHHSCSIDHGLPLPKSKLVFGGSSHVMKSEDCQWTAPIFSLPCPAFKADNKMVAGCSGMFCLSLGKKHKPLLFSINATRQPMYTFRNRSVQSQMLIRALCFCQVQGLVISNFPLTLGSFSLLLSLPHGHLGELWGAVSSCISGWRWQLEELNICN